MKASFRIICLKNNDQSRKYRDANIKNTNIIVSYHQKNEKNGQEKFIPNLVHLSARLQDDTNQNKHSQSNQNQGQLITSPEKIQQINEGSDGIYHKRAQQLKRLKQMQIQRFFETKRNSIQKQKNTIKSLLGEINFSLNKKKQKRISRMIKSTIKDACGSQKSNNRNEFFDISALQQNKSQLQSDFHNFLTNNKQRISSPPQKDEDLKLKRLSMINPEQSLVQSARLTSFKLLNLFHFQERKSTEKKIRLKQTHRNMSSSSVKEESFLGKSRFQKLMFNYRTNLKTQEQEFEWSKLKDKSIGQKNFTLRTIDL